MKVKKTIIKGGHHLIFFELLQCSEFFTPNLSKIERFNVLEQQTEYLLLLNYTRSKRMLRNISETYNTARQFPNSIGFKNTY